MKVLWKNLAYKKKWLLATQEYNSFFVTWREQEKPEYVVTRRELIEKRCKGDQERKYCRSFCIVARRDIYVIH